MVVTVVRPQTVVSRVGQTVPEVHVSETVTQGEYPWAMRVVELQVYVVEHELLTSSASVPCVVIVNLPTQHYPEVVIKDRVVNLSVEIRVSLSESICVFPENSIDVSVGAQVVSSAFN